ncbi:MAG: hypothetical protein II400_05875, partial [Bacteroidaceae bacterium]|nr:hypothetical protein [Bacteroidaceae bacterium]
MRKIGHRILVASTLVWMALSFGLLMSCSKMKEKRENTLQGAWILKQYVSPEGYVFPRTEDGKMQCRIYNNDSICYECEMMSSISGSFIRPNDKFGITFINKGGGEYLYLEEGDPHPLQFENDTTIVIQFYGRKYTWIRASQMSENEQKDIISMMDNEEWDAENEMQKYVLSVTERKLKTVEHAFGYTIIFVVLLASFIIYYILRARKRNRHLKQQLAQIMEMRTQRLLPVQKALEEVEHEFLYSDYYINLRKQIASGATLSQEEWDELEQRINPVYPGFTNKLFNLC